MADLQGDESSHNRFRSKTKRELTDRAAKQPAYIPPPRCTNVTSHTQQKKIYIFHPCFTTSLWFTSPPFTSLHFNCDAMMLCAEQEKCIIVWNEHNYFSCCFRRKICVHNGLFIPLYSLNNDRKKSVSPFSSFLIFVPSFLVKLGDGLADFTHNLPKNQSNFCTSHSSSYVFQGEKFYRFNLIDHDSLLIFI